MDSTCVRYILELTRCACVVCMTLCRGRIADKMKVYILFFSLFRVFFSPKTHFIHPKTYEFKAYFCVIIHSSENNDLTTWQKFSMLMLAISTGVLVFLLFHSVGKQTIVLHKHGSVHMLNMDRCWHLFLYFSLLNFIKHRIYFWSN